MTRRPTGFAAPTRSISSRFGKCSSAPVSTTPAGDGVDADPRCELDAEVAHERLERRLRRPDEDVVLEHPLSAERGERDDRRAVRHLRRGDARELEQGARVRVQRPVPVLVLGLERGADHAGRGVVHEHVERAERRDLVEHALRGDVAADERRLGAGARSSSAVSSAALSLRR